MDAFFHSRYHTEVVRQVENCDVMTMRTSELAVRIFEPARFKRISVDESEGAVPFFGTSPLLWADPKPNRFLSRSFPGVEQYLVGERTILVPRSGQLSGIIGTSILPYGPLVGGAVSEDAIRIECPSAEDAGFLFVALTSQFGLRQLKARACGSSIPHLDVSQIGQVLVPVPRPQIRSELGCLGARVAHLRGQAIGVEAEARQIVERAIEEAT
jgi:type I restriction enzyme S subunit